MSKIQVGKPFDEALSKLPKEEIFANLESVAAKIEERSYTKNLTEEELDERKNEYSQIGIKLSELNAKKKEVMEQFKNKMKEPQARSAELIEAIKYKSEQRYGALFLIDDQENGVMNIFDTNGICVESRPLTREERQLTLRIAKND